MDKTLTLPATLDNLESFMALGRDAAVSCGMDDAAVHQVELALEEVLVNVINYAYASSPDQTPEQDQTPAQETDQPVELCCTCENDHSLTITITDRGKAFDPLDKPDPDTSLSVEDRAIGGLGIFLAKHMMDKITYERRRDKNILTLVKNNKE